MLLTEPYLLWAQKKKIVFSVQTCQSDPSISLVLNLRKLQNFEFTFLHLFTTKTMVFRLYSSLNKTLLQNTRIAGWMKILFYKQTY